MNEDYKRNENCIVGLPRCDYVFNSNRSCFIAYGFLESRLETEILRNLLHENSIEVFEAGGNLESGKNAFCTKICSKIIVSQFCIVLLNQDDRDGIKMPNANVNMEYGLMLGFNKYIIPFQRHGELLPFNVSGLDTIKYDQSNFKEKAGEAIEQAIEQTKPKIGESISADRIIDAFIMMNDALFCPIDEIGNKTIYNL
ncbi:MAG: nucleotide-binding protein [Candidatus Hatepunaea meridiana]|nr:nucleotide-binding protein [Candidatus Hatepunaea meridiana]